VFVREEDRDYILRVGENKVTSLSLELFNSGEDAHDTTISVMLPEDMDYLGTDSRVRYYYSYNYYYYNVVRTIRPFFARVSEQMEPRFAANRHTTAPISHTRPSSRSL